MSLRIFLVGIFLAQEMSCYFCDAVFVPCAPSSPRSKAAKSWLLCLHNFGPASTRDNVLYTAERPGNPSTKDGSIRSDAVQQWMNFMHHHSVSNVLSLLSDNELAQYGSEHVLPAAYHANGITYHAASMKDAAASRKIFDIIQAVELKHEKIVVHCTGGVGRAGRVAAGWLVTRYGQTPAAATQEVLQVAQAFNMQRKGDAEMLQAWLAH